MYGLVTERYRGQAERVVRRTIRPGKVARLKPDETLHVLSTMEIHDPDAPRAGDILRTESGFKAGDVEEPGLATCLRRP